MAGRLSVRNSGESQKNCLFVQVEMELMDSWSLQSLHTEEMRSQPTSNQLEMLGLAPPTTNSSIQLICISVKENASAQQQPLSSRPACLKSVH